MRALLIVVSVLAVLGLAKATITTQQKPRTGAHVSKARQHLRTALGQVLLNNASGAEIKPPADICDHVIAMGYPCEHLYATTMDGFVLNIVHLIPKDPANGTAARPIVLQHGLLCTSMTYLGNSDPKLNLATILHDQGYDVYLPNSRGNHYSLTNVNFPERNRTYWQMVDWDEMASFDVPAVIDRVLEHSNNSTAANASTVTWVGHSQGTAMIFAGMSLSAKQYASKINLFVALAPVAYVGHTTSWLLRLLADVKLGTVLLDLGIESLLEDDGLAHAVADLCPDVGKFCADALGLVLGFGNMSNFAPSIYPEVTHYTPGGTSTSNLIHWAQMVHSSAFQMHNFGERTNERFYHQKTAPLYNLSDFAATLPTVLVTGSDDALADPRDVERLVEQLPKESVVDRINIANYAHMDFVWGLDAHTRIYPTVIGYIDKHARG